MNVGSNLLLNLGTENAAGAATVDVFQAADAGVADVEQGFQLKLAEELDSQQQAGNDGRHTSVPEHDLPSPQLPKLQDTAIRQQIAVTALSAEEAGPDQQATQAESAELAETASLPEVDQTWWNIVEKARTYSSVTSLTGAVALPATAVLPEDLQRLPAAGSDKRVTTMPVEVPADMLAEAMAESTDTAIGSAALTKTSAEVAASALSATAEPALPVAATEQAVAPGAGAALNPSEDALPAATTLASSAGAAALSDKPDLTATARTASGSQQVADTVEQPLQSALAQSSQARGDGQEALSTAPTGPQSDEHPATKEPAKAVQSSVSVVNSAESRASERTAAASDDTPNEPVLTAQPSVAEKPAASLANAQQSVPEPAANRHQSAFAEQSAVAARSSQVETVAVAANELTAVAGPVTAAAASDSTKPTSSNVAEKSDKLTASNSFAEHQKAANQQLQQQLQQQKQQSGQQSGQQSSQNPRQYAAALTSAAELSQPTTLAVGGMTFSSQLQQLTEQPAAVTGQPATPSLVTPAQTLSAALATQQTGKAAELQLPQTPLMLAEPHAAQQIKDRVMVQIQHKLQTAEVQLHPEDLGAMQIKLNLQQDQLSVQFVVQQGAAKEALEQQMPKLRDLLEQQGIALADSEIEERSSQQQERGQGHSGRGGQLAEEQVAERAVQISVSDRMVDYYA